MFRVSRGETGFDADSLDQSREYLGRQKPCRYHVDEISADPLPSGHKSRQWGVAISRPDGSVELEPHPWEV